MFVFICFVYHGDFRTFATARRCLMLVFIIVSWVPFRTGSLAELGRYLRSMLLGGFAPIEPAVLLGVTPFVVAALAIAILSLFGRRDSTGFASVYGTRSVAELERFRWGLAIPSTVILLAVSVVVLLWSGFSPFLYFQF